MQGLIPNCPYAGITSYWEWYYLGYEDGQVEKGSTDDLKKLNNNGLLKAIDALYGRRELPVVNRAWTTSELLEEAEAQVMRDFEKA